MCFFIGEYFIFAKYISQNNFFDEHWFDFLAKTSGIYYLSGNELYRIDPGQINPLAKKLTGEAQVKDKIIDISLDRNKRFLFESTLSKENISAIWRFYIEENYLEKIFSAETPGLEKFTAFRSPQISPDNAKVAFLATKNNSDYLFEYNLSSHKLTNLTGGLFSGAITCYAWSFDSLALAFSDKNDALSTIRLIGSDQKVSATYKVTGMISQIGFQDNRLIVLKTINQPKSITSSINAISLDSAKETSLIDIFKDEQILSYRLSPDKLYIVFVSKNLKTKVNKLYQRAIDGSGLMEINSDTEGDSPIFSPESNRIAFVKNEGVFTVNVNEIKADKIFVDKNDNLKLIEWR